MTKKYIIGAQSSLSYSPTTLLRVADRQAKAPMSIMSRSSSEIQLLNTSFKNDGRESYISIGKCGSSASSKIHFDPTTPDWNFGFLDFWISEVVPSAFPDPSFRFLLEPKFQKSKEPFSMLWIFEAEMSIPASFASWKKVAMVTPLPFAERHLSYCLSVSRWSYFPFCLLTQWKNSLPVS